MSAATLQRRPGRPAPPSRIAHLGLGAFSRSHQTWYTHHANQTATEPWGVTGFTGRTGAVADTLTRQDGLYHLVTRDNDGDRYELITAVTATHDGADLLQLASVLAADTTALVTMTISEAGYYLTSTGRLNTNATAVQDDITTLSHLFARRTDSFEAALGSTMLTSTPARLLLGLQLRRRQAGGPLAIVPCDNLSRNGAAVQRLLLELSSRVDPGLTDWIEGSVSFVNTSVDRITPAATAADRADVKAATGFADQTPVIAEPFTDWVLSGAFPSGRPAWEAEGARMVDDIRPFEQRKLWLLNGGHSSLAYAGWHRGFTTVADAVSNPELRQQMSDFWDEAASVLPQHGLDLDGYRTKLLARFDNGRIRHLLAQIAAEGSTKVRLRAVPVVVARRKAGQSSPATARLIAQWVNYVLDAEDLVDADRALLRTARRGSLDDAVPRILAVADPHLPDDTDVLADVRSEVGALQATRTRS